MLKAVMRPAAIVRIQDLSKAYVEGGHNRVVLDKVNAEIYEGEFFVMLGKSGTGKSTLLNMLSGIDSPDAGAIQIDGMDMTALNDAQKTRFRREHIGIIFQFFNLIPTLTALENITLPQELRGVSRRETETGARRLLRRVGLEDRADTFPDKLSGGEQQRIAIARALLHRPKLLLADEPTGDLDEETGSRILSILLELTREMGRTLVMATHHSEIVPFADRVGRIYEGQLHISRNSSPRPIGRGKRQIDSAGYDGK